MSYYVHIHVCFACNENEGVAALAVKHYEAVGECQEAQWFLNDLAKRTGNNPGPKGGLSTWGIIGKNTHGERFVETLRPFWKELLAGVEGGPLPFTHILVFVEREQTEQATAFEIFLAYDNNLIVLKHELPFTFATV